MPFVVAAQGGDREAYAELYRRFGKFVHAILLARVPYDAAADLAQGKGSSCPGEFSLC